MLPPPRAVLQVKLLPILEKTKISFTKSSILFKPFENRDVENAFQKIREIYLQEETDQRKIFVLFAEDDSKMLLITAGVAIKSEINRPLLMVFDDEMMNSGVLFSLNRINNV